MSAQQRGEETRRRIMDAAQECFAQQGYDATGVAAICRRAGVTKGAFYHHFASKQSLFLEMLDEWLAVLDTQLTAVRDSAASVPQALLQMAGMVQPVFYQASGRLPMFLEYWTKATHDTAVWEATIAPYRRYRSFFAAMIRDGIAAGTIRPVDPDAAASVLVSLAAGLIMQGVMDPEGADWGQIAHEGVRIFLAGLQNSGQEERE